jgi:tripartite-type tricarboxylate transporter receptor subunit TctC
MAGCVAASACVAAMVVPTAFAQTWPAKPIRWIVSYAPGSTGDIFARLLAARCGESLGQQLVIENRGGANGNVGTAAGAKAAADGYTFLLAGNASLAINPHLTAGLQYDPVRDFAPVMLIGSVPLLLNAHPALPIRTPGELLALARARPGQIDYASGGNGTSTHLAGELLNMMGRVSLRHVPYRTSAQAITDLMGGHMMLMFTGLPTTLSQIKAGKLRPVTVTGSRRSTALPDVPALAETLPGYEVSAWYGLLAPAGTPGEIVTRMHGELARALQGPDVQDRFRALGADVAGGSPDAFATYIRDELSRWGKVVKAAGAKLD